VDGDDMILTRKIVLGSMTSVKTLHVRVNSKLHPRDLQCCCRGCWWDGVWFCHIRVRQTAYL